MHSLRLSLVLLLTLAGLFGAWAQVHAEDRGAEGRGALYATATQDVTEPDVVLFYSPTCPHCHKERDFLRELQDEYPELTVVEYSVFDEASLPVLFEYAGRAGLSQESLGAVPITFVRGTALVGFESDVTTGTRIRDLLELGSTSTSPATSSPTLPLVGALDTSGYPLALLAALLGFLDGWNICSLGALALIIGLALSLGKRKDMVLLGGTFLLVTALSYGVLIALWYALFAALRPFVGVLELLVGFVALVGAVYFFREYFRMRRVGPTCSLRTFSLIDAVTERTKHVVMRRASIVASLGVVGLFALVVTVIEFPCSAAIPVMFAGLLAERGVSSLPYLGYSAIFLLFYLLDELVLFAFAVYRLKLVAASPRGAKLVVLAEACVLLVFAAWYLGARFI